MDFEANSSLEPIMLQNNSFDMVDLEGNLNPNDTSDCQKNQIMIVDNINRIMEHAKSLLPFENENSLQEFKAELEKLDKSNLNKYSFGTVEVTEAVPDEEENSLSDSSYSGQEEMNLLQKACYYKLYNFAKELLKINPLQGHVDPNHIMSVNGTPPILLAAYHGHLELIKILVENKVGIFFLGY